MIVLVDWMLVNNLWFMLIGMFAGAGLMWAWNVTQSGTSVDSDQKDSETE